MLLSKFSWLNFYVVALVMAMHLTLCHANSAGTGIPCSVPSNPDTWTKLGHPNRGGLQAFQDRIDAAQGDMAKAVVKAERLDAMHKLEAEGYIMYWAVPPVHSTRYTVRTGDGLVANDPITYTPGEWMNIYVRAIEEGEKFIGLVLHAADAQGRTVGDWQVDSNSAFRYGGPGTCITHRNAEFKSYRNVFRFKAPAASTGTITFFAMVKVGLAFPVLDGNFYYPNTQHLSLTEGPVATQKWFEGQPGQSCDQVCTSFNMQCDIATLYTIGYSKTDFYAMAQRFSPSCIEPIMGGCGPATPSVGNEGCFFHDEVCGAEPVLPPVVRKDPCEGLTLFTQQNGRLNALECVKWSYIRQNNGIGASVYNKLYNEGQLVKVCTGTSAELKTQDSFNDNMKIEGLCAPPGGFTSSPTPSPPPAKVMGATTCSATDSDLSDGARICACQCTDGVCSGSGKGNGGVIPEGTGAAPPGGAPAPPPDMGGVSRVSSPNMVLVSVVVLLATMNQLDSRMSKMLSILSLSLSVNAHNWMSSPSRANNGFNAYQTAPCPPKGSRVHFQVAAGQKFPMEFATGHSTPARGGTYLTVLRAEDEPQMGKHTRALLDDYLASAPARDPPYMANFKSHHVGSTSASTTTTSVLTELSAQFGVGNQKDNIRDYGPNWGNKPPMGAGIYPKKESSTADDLRVQYKSDKYPWIISVSKFKLHEDKSEEADLVMMEIPVGSAVGQYVVQYSWNGYYDCTDVNVIAATSTDFYGSPASEVQFDKLDHCLWNPIYANYQALGECKQIVQGESADACFNQCKEINGCYGVQVVPYKLPVELVGKKGMFQNRGSTMPTLCNNLQNVADDSLVCFPIKQGTSVVGSTYTISDDPYDSIFYGTCYIKGGAWNFAQAGPGGAVVPQTDSFKFGGQECISCNTMRNNKVDGVVPFWDITFGTCEHCDRTLG